MNRILRILLLPVLLLVVLPARADLEFDVVGGSVGAQPIAIVPFSGNDGVMDVAQVIQGDLDRSGLFKGMDRNSMPERPSDPRQVDYMKWKSAGQNNIVIGTVRRDPGSDRSVVRFFLLDVNQGVQTLAFEMPAADPQQLRYTAHQVADMVFEKLLGYPGVFNTRIAYVKSQGYGLDRKYQLMYSDWDGENARPIANSREPLMSPQWSPDRKKLAYVGYERGHSSIYIHELATGKVKKVVSEKGINGSPAWSPDGTKLAVTLSYESNPDIYVIDIASGAKRRITTTEGIDTEPSWSPDGQNIVFTSERGGPPQIYRVSASGGEPTRLTFQGRQNLRASYSPDGKSIVLVNLDESRYRIALLDVGSGQMVFLSDGRFDEGPSWAPNGKVVIYATQGPKGAELATVSYDGRVRQRLRETGDVREPAWSPLQK